MPTLTRLQFTATIQAPAAVVWQHVTDADSYRHWTSAFAEGSRYEGAWHTGASIRFLGPNGDGMLSEIAESRAPVFLSIRHLGVLHQGVPDTTSDAVRAWAPAYENYRLEPVPEGTRMVVDQEVSPEWADDLGEAWPRALQLLKDLCEARPSP